MGDGKGEEARRWGRKWCKVIGRGESYSPEEGTPLSGKALEKGEREGGAVEE